MKLNGVQAQGLFQIAIDSLRIAGVIGFDEPARRKLVNEIINQQGQEVIDLSLAAALSPEHECVSE